MPEISRFFGIVIKMHTRDHNPPHLHAEYAGMAAVIGLNDLSVIKGSLPPRALGLVTEWAAMHQGELLAGWERAQAGEAPGKIEPLD